MFNIETIQSENFYTEGFSPSIKDNIISFTEGAIIFETGETYRYNAFSFEVDLANEFQTIYDVYLLEDNSVHLDITEIAEGVLAYYEGDIASIHTLTSFSIPTNLKTLEGVNINVRKVVLQNDVKAEQEMSIK